MAKVTYKRVETNDLVNGIPIVDGQLIYSKQGKTYMDYGEERVAINGTTDTEINDSSTNPVENRIVKQYVDTQIALLNNNIHNGSILWTNPNPSSDFSASTITLNSSDYDILIWLFQRQSSQTTLISPTITIKGYSGMAFSQTATGENRRRGCEYLSDTTYSISDSIAPDGNVYNGSIIPLLVIGINTGLFQ